MRVPFALYAKQNVSFVNPTLKSIMKSFLSQRAAYHATLERICSSLLSDSLRTRWHHANGMLAVRTANRVCTNSVYVFFFFCTTWKVAFPLGRDVIKPAKQSWDVKTSCQSMFASSGASAPGASQNFWGACVCAWRDCWPPACWAMMSSCLAVAFNSWKQAGLELGLKGTGALLLNKALTLLAFLRNQN